MHSIEFWKIEKMENMSIKLAEGSHFYTEMLGSHLLSFGENRKFYTAVGSVVAEVLVGTHSYKLGIWYFAINIVWYRTVQCNTIVQCNTEQYSGVECGVYCTKQTIQNTRYTRHDYNNVDPISALLSPWHCFDSKSLLLCYLIWTSSSSCM